MRSYINGLPLNERVDGLSVLQALERNELETLTIKSWQGKITEVYFYKHNRIFCVIVEGGEVYLLHACKKQKNKTEKRDSELVIRRAKEIKKLLTINLI